MSNETNATIDEIIRAVVHFAAAEIARHNMPSSLRAGVCARKEAEVRHLVTKALDSQAQQIAALTQDLAESRAEIAECDALRSDMAAILRAVAIAVRGPEVDGISWGWADLPDRVTATVNMMSGAVELAREHAAEIEVLTAERDELKHGRRQQHDADSAELRRLCAERDGLRKRLDAQATPAPGEWVEWQGGEVAPVADGVRHEVRLRDGRELFSLYAGSWIWSVRGIEADIVAYRVAA